VKLSRPTITEARLVCEAHGARAAILIVFGDGHYAAASYGETKAECASTGRTLDAIVEALQDGTLPVPEVQP
jgi:hypothetical protein